MDDPRYDSEAPFFYPPELQACDSTAIRLDPTRLLPQALRLLNLTHGPLQRALIDIGPGYAVVRYGHRPGKGEDRDPYALAAFLDEWVGGDGGFVDVRQLIKRAEGRAKELLHPAQDFVPESAALACLDLVTFLRDWLDLGCVHNFRPVAEDEFFWYFSCDNKGCGLSEAPCVEISKDTPELLAAMVATCERCGKPMERSDNGRTKRFCSDACRQVVGRIRRKESAA